MKHIFFVHSPITVLVSKLVIKEEKISADDVIFFTSRGTQIEKGQFQNYEFRYYDYSDVPQTRNLLKCVMTLAMFDAYIKKIIGKTKFKCYVPQNTNRGIELLINSRQCISFSIIEEGAASYYPMEYPNNEYGNLRVSVWDWIGYMNRLKRKYFYRPDYEKVYGLTEESFPDFRDRIILSWQKLKSNAYNRFHGHAFLIYDDIIVKSILEDGNILKGVNEFLKTKDNFNKLYYKFHPRHTEEQKSDMRELMQQELTIELEELPANFSIELMAVNAQNLTFIINLSSLGFYAAFFEHKVFSYALWFKFGNNFLQKHTLFKGSMRS